MVDKRIDDIVKNSSFREHQELLSSLIDYCGYVNLLSMLLGEVKNRAKINKTWSKAVPSLEALVNGIPVK